MFSLLTKGVKKKKTMKTKFSCTLYNKIVFSLFFKKGEKNKIKSWFCYLFIFGPKKGTTLSLLVSLFFLYENISDDGGGARTKARSCGGMMVLDTMVRTQGAGGAGEESRARGSEVGNDIQHRWWCCIQIWLVRGSVWGGGSVMRPMSRGEVVARGLRAMVMGWAVKRRRRGRERGNKVFCQVCRDQ